MEWFKPPTDNLYKFCFVGGLLIAIFGFYEDYKINESLQEINSSYNSESISLHLAYDQLLAGLLPPVPFETISIDVLNDDLDKFERQQKSKLEVIKNNLLLIVVPPPAMVSRKRLFQTEVKKQIMERMGIDTDDAYKEFIDKKTDEEIDKINLSAAQVAANILTQWSKTLHGLGELCDQMRALKGVRSERDCLLWVGGAITIFFGLLWFWRVQRHQDNVLRAEANKKRGELTKPKSIFVRRGRPRP